MNLKTVKYTAIALGLTAMFTFSGCKDFLDRDAEDGYSVESVKTFDQYLGLTNVLYGGRMWVGYHSKYNWVVNEGLAGNLINIYDEEGALYLGIVAPTNTHMMDGYQTLYSGVIATANYLINKDKPTLTEEEANRIEAEAKMFRGFAYFMATEYWGEVPLVRNNEYVITNKLQVPKTTRATIYKAIEQDWLFAAEHLPKEEWRAGRVTSWAAKGMLAKLYLTMASCQADVSTFGAPYVCPDVDGYYRKAVECATQVIDNTAGFTVVPYADIFAMNNPQGYNSCKEALFSLHLADVEGYSTAAHWQAHMSGAWGPSDLDPERNSEKMFWGPSNWGGWKSLAKTLAESYADGDLRKKEVIFHLEAGTYYNYKGEKENFPYDGDAAGGTLGLNNIKKYVYGYTSPFDPMCSPMRLDFLRMADVYMIRAEAKMALATKDVTEKTSAGMDDITFVVRMHGGDKAVAALPAAMAYCNKVPLDGRELEYVYKGWAIANDDYPDGYDLMDEGKPFRRATMKVPAKRTGEYADFIQERRKEFAMEGHGWVDVKRLFYRDPRRAQEFFKEQDRGWCNARKYGEDIKHGVDSNKESGYTRLALRHKIEKENPDIFGEPEEEGFEPPIRGGLDAALDPFEKGVGVYFTKWFLPIPADVITQLPGNGSITEDFLTEVEEGTYKY